MGKMKTFWAQIFVMLKKQLSGPKEAWEKLLNIKEELNNHEKSIKNADKWL